MSLAYQTQFVVKQPLWLISAFLVCICFLSGCDNSKNYQEAPNSAPKTFYGKTIKKTKDIGSEQEDQAEETKKQYDSLFQDQ